MLYFEYTILFYSRDNLKSPVKEYILKLQKRERTKVNRYIDLLARKKGILASPYAKHISGKLWELRIKWGNAHHRIIYFIDSHRKIVLLSAFLKKSQKTPRNEIEKANNYYLNYIANYE